MGDRPDYTPAVPGDDLLRQLFAQAEADSINIKITLALPFGLVAGRTSTPAEYIDESARLLDGQPGVASLFAREDDADYIYVSDATVYSPIVRTFPRILRVRIADISAWSFDDPESTFG
jgi:hypothetical protein